MLDSLICVTVALDMSARLSILWHNVNVLLTNVNEQALRSPASFQFRGYRIRSHLSILIAWRDDRHYRKFLFPFSMFLNANSWGEIAGNNASRCTTKVRKCLNMGGNMEIIEWRICRARLRSSRTIQSHPSPLRFAFAPVALARLKQNRSLR
jgi:hypothetical protein